jgi:hypothetical protein
MLETESLEAFMATIGFGDEERLSSICRQFTEWSAERCAVEVALDATPESDPETRDRLLDRAVELENLILNTPGQALEAIRAKARTLRHLMEMARADELAVMREIETFVDTFAQLLSGLGPAN